MTLKTKLVIVGVVLVGILAAYFIGHRKGVNSANDDIRIKQLKYQYDSLEKVLIVSAFRLRQKDDSIAKRDAHIESLKSQVLNDNFRIQRINQAHEKQIYSITNAPLTRLDSLRWARYPDSTTVAGRGNH